MSREEAFERAEEAGKEFLADMQRLDERQFPAGDSRNWILNEDLGEPVREYLIAVAAIIAGNSERGEMPMLVDHAVSVIESEVPGAERRTVREALDTFLDRATGPGMVIGSELEGSA